MKCAKAYAVATKEASAGGNSSGSTDVTKLNRTVAEVRKVGLFLSALREGMRNDEFCIKDDEIFIKNDETCIKNDEF